MMSQLLLYDLVLAWNLGGGGRVPDHLFWWGLALVS